jgi:hypothetical protein
MSEFPKRLFAVAAGVLFARLVVPVSAQSTTVCTIQSATDNLVRAEGFAEPIGDVLLACTGGTPTAAGKPVPQINIQVFLSQNVTSMITAAIPSGNFLEALLIIDEPNSPASTGGNAIYGNNSAVPILNCGQTGAPDTSLSGPGVCSIISAGPNGSGASPYTYNGTPGHPNVFQGRQALNGNNSIVFQGVPFDPPGAAIRYLRFTNIRVNANGAGVAQANQTSIITMGIASSGNNVLQLSIASQAVATVLPGIISSTQNTNMGLAQCVSTSTLFGSGSPVIRFAEGFSSSWKVKNVAYTVGALGGNGTYTGGTPGSDAYTYSGSTNNPPDVNQNVPGVAYNSESLFTFPSVATNPSPNPPLGFQTFGNTGITSVTGATNPFGNAHTNTGISQAGIASQGTRLAVALANIPNGASILVSPILYLYGQGTAYITPDSNNGLATGVMVLTNTLSDGSGAFNSNVMQPITVTNGSALVVYEVLFADAYSSEYVDVPIDVSYAPNLSGTPPLPQTSVIATYAAGFAPFYSTAAATLASATLPVPRFAFTGASRNLFEIVPCTCNLLFPYVTQAPGYDTGIAVANTTQDPYGTTNQAGPVQFWYYGALTNGGAPPGTQCTNTASPGTCPGTTSVGAGQVLTYTLYNGSAQWGFDNRGAGFTGYMIAQAQFQYCHAFAFIGGLGGGPAVNSATNGLSEGYLALVLDAAGLIRTNVTGESLGQ